MRPCMSGRHPSSPLNFVQLDDMRVADSVEETPRCCAGTLRVLRWVFPMPKECWLWKALRWFSSWALRQIPSRPKFASEMWHASWQAPTLHLSQYRHLKLGRHRLAARDCTNEYTTSSWGPLLPNAQDHWQDYLNVSLVPSRRRCPTASTNSFRYQVVVGYHETQPRLPPNHHPLHQGPKFHPRRDRSSSYRQHVRQWSDFRG
mmetsp:Transcript_988/g.1698  ORF Transcript_988/g.1698 Transcript_988/m.1698 type:complete len:203 (+) Transcript_988:791-1399(+)